MKKWGQLSIYWILAFQLSFLKRKKPEGRSKSDQPSGLSIMCETRSGYIPLLLLCGDFVKKVSIAKQKKMNGEAEMCPFYFMLDNRQREL